MSVTAEAARLSVSDTRAQAGIVVALLVVFGAILLVGVRYWRFETRSPYPETRNPETRNAKPSPLTLKGESRVRQMYVPLSSDGTLPIESQPFRSL